MGQKDESSAMNISLPQAQREYVEARVASGGYRSASEYIADLIRRDQREAARTELEKALHDGLASGAAQLFDESYFEQQRERIRKAGSRERAS
jgi:antitoxin ParD1/3/4